MTFLYHLRDPRTKVIRYIGISRDPVVRMHHHLKKARKRLRRASWIQSLLREGVLPEMVLLCSFETLEQAQLAEVLLIAALREEGLDLVNDTLGGEGVHGFQHSAEAREAISRKLTGRVLSPEWRAKLSAWQEGRTLPAEHRAKISEGGRRAWLTRPRTVSQETRDKISATLRARTST